MQKSFISVVQPTYSTRGFGKGWPLLLIPFALLVTGAGPKSEPLSPGPDPTWEGAVSLAEAALKNNLIDPQSAQIEWPYNFISGSTKAFLRKRKAGWYTCGEVNAKNRMGGYTGKVWFFVMINSGVVTQIEIGSIDGIDPASITCSDLVQKGMLPPAPAPMSSSAGSATVPVTAEAFLTAADKGARDAAARGGIGISFQATPYGVRIAAVASGSPAEKAGLKSGEVIESINGIGTKTLDQNTISSIFANAGNEIELSIVGIGVVKIVR